MNTSLVVIDTESAYFNYGMAMVFFIVDMEMIKRGTATLESIDFRLMNEYIDKAISSMY